MQAIPGQVQDRSLSQRNADTRIPTTSLSVKEIPYDYVAKFILEGKQGNRVLDVINISMDGAFVAVEAAYSFIPGLKVKNPIDAADAEHIPGLFGALFAPFIERVQAGDSDQEKERKRREAEQLIVSPIRGLLAKLCGIDFKYSIVDSGSGRELQNLAIHNIAGFGEPNGERPFRPMAKPMMFMPRSTIRIEVEEVSEGPFYQKAELYIVLHGYKMLGYGIG